MKNNMSVCEICGKNMNNSHYHIPSEIKVNDKIKFVHTECCSREDIKENLLLYANNQVGMYHDIIDLAKNTSLDKINQYEKKYGSYEEISQGIQLDRDLMLSALISELRTKLEHG